MTKVLSKKSAATFLNLDEKIFDNYFKNAEEFPCLERNSGKGRFSFDENKLKEWRDSFI